MEREGEGLIRREGRGTVREGREKRDQRSWWGGLEEDPERLWWGGGEERGVEGGERLRLM